jgi:2-methylcitrate dehydratase PrpD
VLGGLDDERTRNALGIAMCTGGGVYESVGSMTLPYITGFAARNGLTAYQLAARGFDAPVTALEGEKGMLASCSDEPAEKIDEVIAALGSTWRIHGQSYKTMLTETITHAPLECTFRLCERTGDREVERMRFTVAPVVVKIANERRERFGDPSSELEARFDLRHCVAAAWRRGRFTRAEMQEAAYADPDVLNLRSRIELAADPAREAFEWASLEIEFADGSTDATTVDAFKGSAANPLTDEELGDLFLATAEPYLPAGRAAQIVDAVFRLDDIADVRRLTALLVS